MELKSLCISSNQFTNWTTSSTLKTLKNLKINTLFSPQKIYSNSPPWLILSSCFPIGFEICFTEWYSMSGLKAFSEAHVCVPSIECTIDILLHGHASNCHLNMFVYAHRQELLSAMVTEASFFGAQPSVQTVTTIRSVENKRLRPWPWSFIIVIIFIIPQPTTTKAMGTLLKRKKGSKGQYGEMYWEIMSSDIVWLLNS